MVVWARGWSRRRAVLSLFSLLVLGAAGCHHKNSTASYQPPPPAIAPSTGAGEGRPAHAGSGNPLGQRIPQSAGTASPAPQPAAHGRPVSVEVGLASWYGPPYANRKGADGTIYDQNAMTAAHRELPMGSIVKVTNLTNNQSVTVRITDRGPFVDGRIIDLSLAAAKSIDVYRRGTAKVRVEAFAPPARPGVDPEGKWCVQIGAFLDEADAIQLKNDLLRRYATARVIEFAGPTGHWVRINPKNPDRATAHQIAQSILIPDPGAQPYLVRLD
jgi:rare lipoprotein A